MVEHAGYRNAGHAVPEPLQPAKPVLVIEQNGVHLLLHAKENLLRGEAVAVGTARTIHLLDRWSKMLPPPVPAAARLRSSTG
jgi:hypothetical protein